MKFVVITKTPDITEEGNRAVSFLYKSYDKINNAKCYVVGISSVKPLPKPVGIVHVPVFDEGEIVICDDSGREIDGMKRKPSKWHINFTEFDTLEKAIALVNKMEGE